MNAARMATKFLCRLGYTYNEQLAFIVRNKPVTVITDLIYSALPGYIKSVAVDSDLTFNAVEATVLFAYCS